jgi:hypothetical protein
MTTTFYLKKKEAERNKTYANAAKSPPRPPSRPASRPPSPSSVKMTYADATKSPSRPSPSIKSPSRPSSPSTMKMTYADAIKSPSRPPPSAMKMTDAIKSPPTVKNVANVDKARPPSPSYVDRLIQQSLQRQASGPSLPKKKVTAGHGRKRKAGYRGINKKGTTKKMKTSKRSSKEDEDWEPSKRSSKEDEDWEPSKRSSKDEDQTPSPPAFEVGTKIRKSFPPDTTLWSGTVTHVPSATRKLYLVVYSDGDKEDLNEEEIRKYRYSDAEASAPFAVAPPTVTQGEGKTVEDTNKETPAKDRDTAANKKDKDSATNINGDEYSAKDFLPGLYYVQKLVSRREVTIKNRTRFEYRVRWCQYSSSDDTWELADNLPDEMVEEYDKTHPHTPKESTTPPKNDEQKRRPPFADDYSDDGNVGDDDDDVESKTPSELEALQDDESCWSKDGDDAEEMQYKEMQGLNLDDDPFGDNFEKEGLDSDDDISYSSGSYKQEDNESDDEDFLPDDDDGKEEALFCSNRRRGFLKDDLNDEDPFRRKEKTGRRRTVDNPHPFKEHNQIDDDTIDKLKALQKPLKTVQIFMTPMGRYDEEAAREAGYDDERIRMMKEEYETADIFLCYTSRLRPNADGKRGAAARLSGSKYHAKEQIHFLGLCESSIKVLESLIQSKKMKSETGEVTNAAEIKYHTNWPSFFTNFKDPDAKPKPSSGNRRGCDSP